MSVYPLNRHVKYQQKKECPTCGFDFLFPQDFVKRYDGVWVCHNDNDPEPRDWRRRAIKSERALRSE